MHPPLFDQEVGAQVNDNEPPGSIIVTHSIHLVHTRRDAVRASASTLKRKTAKLFVILIQASATLALLHRVDCSLFPSVCVSLFFVRGCVFIPHLFASPPSPSPFPFTPFGRGDARLIPIRYLIIIPWLTNNDTPPLD